MKISNVFASGQEDSCLKPGSRHTFAYERVLLGRTTNCIVYRLVENLWFRKSLAEESPRGTEIVEAESAKESLRSAEIVEAESAKESPRGAEKIKKGNTSCGK